jgi:phage baseplate assembly protein W
VAAHWGDAGLVWGAATGNWGGNIFNDTLTESVSASTSFAASTAMLATLSEAATATDSLAGTANYASPITTRAMAWGALSAIWSANQGTFGDPGALDGVSATQQFACPLTESVTAADTMAAAAAYLAALSESVAAADAFAASLAIQLSIAETLNAADALAVSVDYSATIVDSPRKWGVLRAIWSGNQGFWGELGPTDSLDVTQQFNCPLTEQVTAADSLVSVAAFQASLSEAAAAADSMAASLGIFTTLLETAAAADALTATAQFNSPLSEAVAAADAFSARVDFVSVLVESAEASVEFFIAIPHGVVDPVFTPTDPLGSDVSCFPDLEGTGSLISGKLVLAQALARRLTTARGSLFYDKNYGTDLRMYLNEGLTNEAIWRVKASVESECLKDERVARASADVSFSLETETLHVLIEIDTNGGPFALTLSITALTIDLLTVT